MNATRTRYFNHPGMDRRYRSHHWAKILRLISSYNVVAQARFPECVNEFGINSEGVEYAPDRPKEDQVISGTLCSPYYGKNHRNHAYVSVRLFFYTLSILALCSLAAASSAAKTPKSTSNEVELAVRCYASLNYGCTIEKLAPIVSSLSDQADPEETKKVQLYFALALVGADRQSEAEPYFRRLLSTEPHLKLDPKQHSSRAITALDAVRKTMIREALPWDLDPGNQGIVSVSRPLPANAFELSEPRTTPRPTAAEDLPWAADLGVVSSFPMANTGDYGIGFGIRLALQRYFSDLFIGNVAISAVNHPGSSDSQGESLWLVSILASGGISFVVAPWARVEALATVGAVPIGLGTFGGDVAFGAGGTAVARFRMAGGFGLSVQTSALWINGDWPGTNGKAVFMPTVLSASFSF